LADVRFNGEKLRQLSMALVWLVLLSGCADSSTSAATATTGGRGPSEQPVRPAGEKAQEQTATQPVVVSEVHSSVLKQARVTLAEHLNLPDVDKAELVAISARQWPSASLGCAQPGEMSAQVITPGYKVVLALAGTQHHVHLRHVQGTKSSGRVCGRLQDTPLDAVDESSQPEPGHSQQAF